MTPRSPFPIVRRFLTGWRPLMVQVLVAAQAAPGMCALRRTRIGPGDRGGFGVCAVQGARLARLARPAYNGLTASTDGFTASGGGPLHPLVFQTPKPSSNHFPETTKHSGNRTVLSL